MQIGKVDPFLRQSAGTTSLNCSKSSLTLRPYQSLRFARPRCEVDLRGHHDDLHGSNAVFKACRSLFNLDCAKLLLLVRARLSFRNRSETDQLAAAAAAAA